MKQRKKILMSAVIILIMLIVTACGSSNSGGSNDSTGSNQSNQTQTGGGSGDTLTFKLATHVPVDHPLTVGAMKLKEILEDISDQRITVEVYPNLQLGSLSEQVESTQLGSIEMTIALASTISTFDPVIEVLQYPYLLPTNEDELWAMIDGEVGEYAANSLSNHGFHVLGYWPQSYKTLTGNKPFLSPDDLKGVKMRVVPSNILIKQFEAWGANPVAIDFAELYTSLQQGTADAQENPLDTNYSTKMYEVQSHLTELNHAYQLDIMLANKQWWDSLDPEFQELITQAHDEALRITRENNPTKNEEYRELLRQEGMEIHQLTEEQIASFREISVQTHDELAQTDGQKELLNLIRELSK